MEEQRAQPFLHPSGQLPAPAIVDVPDRSAIHIHIAQIVADILGCVGVGKSHGVLKNHWAVMQSRAAFAEFMSRMEALERLDSDLWIAIGNVTADGGVLSESS